MKEANSKIFAKLAALVDAAGVAHHVANIKAPRWVKTSEEEKDFLKHAKVEHSSECLPGKWASLVSHSARLFVVLPESRQLTISIQGIKSHPPHAGLLTLLWSLDAHKVITSSDIGVRIAENLFGVEGAYEAATVAPYFAPIQVFEVDQVARGDDPENLIYKVYGVFLLDKDASIPLPYSTSTRARISELIEGECGNIASDVLFRAITASHWTHAFLDFYRCIERLYQVPYVEDLRKGLGTASHATLGEQISKHLDWRPKEDIALKRLLREISNPPLIERLRLGFCKTQAPEPSGLVEMVGGSIYKVRNGIAHFRASRAATQPPANAIGDWDQAIEYLCELISELYKAYGVAIRV
ncbi:hypothetical protein [Hyalangium rubrum]|uniref:RiboL-PSP-HEPN domain-containing protein n=1 Tax=Hyalangium rubrum TaxID=3103134 RepID=A0ABU5HEV3_9BACT|nr:hypothetical protein [Hyalangium sp. s54d21]MDY7231682.1 hypothetical protein [Hyalangium sp. s54d21]